MNLHSVNLNKRKKSLLCNFASPRKKADTAASTNAVAPCDDNSAQWRLSSLVYAVLSQRFWTSNFERLQFCNPLNYGDKKWLI